MYCRNRSNGYQVVLLAREVFVMTPRRASDSSVARNGRLGSGLTKMELWISTTRW